MKSKVLNETRFEQMPFQIISIRLLENSQFILVIYHSDFY